MNTIESKLKSINEKINKVKNSNKKESKKLSEESEEEAAQSAIKTLIETNWSQGDDAYKNLQLMLGLVSNESESAKKFLKKVDDFTSGLKLEDF